MLGKKTGGRTKGTPNKATRELRDRLKAIFYAELDNLPKLLSELTPKERVDVLVKMSPYLLPKVESVDYLEDDPSLDWSANNE